VSARTLRVVVYAAVVFYGSLFPFVGWRATHEGLLDFLAQVPDFHVNRADSLSNVLAYVPFGLFLVRALNRPGPLASVLLATLGGTALSFAMEFLQQFVPGRVASLQDLMTNSIGSFAGALIGVVTRIDVPMTATIARLRREWLGHGRDEAIGLLALGLWVLSQWMPLVPSLDVAGLRHNLAPLWRTLLDPDTFDASRFALYALNLAGLGFLARTLGPDKRLVVAFALLALIVVPGKVAFDGRVLSLEAIAGTLIGIMTAVPALAASRKASAVVAIALLLAAFAEAELRRGVPGPLYPFTWIPFRGQLESPLSGMASLLETVWPAIALSYLTRFVTPARYATQAGWLAGFLLMLLVFALEWNQQFVPGRYGDITPVLLIGATWALTWIAMRQDRDVDRPRRSLRVPGPNQGDLR
jgi:VanZ family protein